MAPRNSGCTFNAQWIENVEINLPAIKESVKILSSQRSVKKEWQVAWLLRGVTCLDLTTLAGDDTFTNVQRLCFKAAYPVREDLLKSLNIANENITTGAVCVYPARVADAVKTLKSLSSDIPVASVATGFPTGQYSLRSRLLEIEDAVQDGASEIDIVISRQLALSGQWEALYNEVKAMKSACGPASMKTILATGELGSLTNVYKASMVCMMAGADFIKTSTGKESVNAILPVGLVMVRAIRDYFDKTGIKVGFKPAGGIRTAKDVIQWQTLMKEELGNEWLMPNLFRIGASGVLGDIEKQIFYFVNGRYPLPNELAMA